MQQGIYKVPNGKLLKIFLETENGKIKMVKITGDFFIHPEEKITALEAALISEPIDEKILRAKLQTIVDKESLELFGVDAESIAKTILLAYQA